MSYSNNDGCRNESNDVDKLLRYWGVSNDPCITNIVGAGIDTEEKRNKLLCTITATFEKHR